MQSSRKRDSSSDRPLKQDSRKREDAMRQTRRMRGNGATRNSIAGADEETRKRGDPGNREADATEDQRPGATQCLITGSAEGCGIGATRNSTQQAQPEERRFGATRRFTTGIAGRCGKRGNPNSHQPASRGKRSFGATRGFNLGKAGRLRTWADPGTDREAALEGEDSGEPGNSTPGSTNDARFGAHRKSITGKSRKASVRGNSRARWEAVLVQRICGATRVSKASSAEGCEGRGNSKLHCRHGLKMQEAG